MKPLKGIDLRDVRLSVVVDYDLARMITTVTVGVDGHLVAMAAQTPGEPTAAMVGDMVAHLIPSVPSDGPRRGTPPVKIGHAWKPPK